MRHSERGAPVVRLDDLELVLPRGRKHFRPLARCGVCLVDVVDRTTVVRRPADLRRLHRGEGMPVVRCGTCTTSDAQQDWRHVFGSSSPQPAEHDHGQYGSAEEAPHRAEGRSTWLTDPGELT